MQAHRTKTRKISAAEHAAIFQTIFDCPWVHSGNDHAFGTRVWMLDDEFLPTQNMASIRWIMTSNRDDCQIFMIDNAGDAIQLIRDSE